MQHGPLLSCAVGDSYGQGYEYANENLQYNDLSRYVKHPRHPLSPGSYTDDTQMSTAIAECLLSDDDPWDKEHIVAAFFRAFKRDPRQGYSAKRPGETTPRFYEFLVRIESPEQFLAEIDPNSDKSGGAMRAGLVGLVPDLRRVVDMTAIQAGITHNTHAGLAGAFVAALTTHYFHYRIGPKADLGVWLNYNVPFYTDEDHPYSWSKPWIGKVKAKGFMAPHAAATAIQQHDSMSEILKACIAFSGDTDTVAAIAMTAASRSVEVRQDLPQVLVDTLENGPWGRDYLQALDKRLLAKFPSP